MVPEISCSRSSCRSPARTLTLAAFASLLLWTATPSRGEDDPRVPVQVQVCFGEVCPGEQSRPRPEDETLVLTRAWGKRQAEIEAELSQLISRQLAETAPYWRFLSPPERTGTVLEIRLFIKRYETFVQVAVRADQEILGSPLLELLYKPNEYHKLADLTNRPLSFVTIARELLRLDTAIDSPVFELLKRDVPVTFEGQWRTAPQGDPSFVLPLPWEPHFKKLRASLFKFEGIRENHKPQVFRGPASSIPGRYPVELTRQQAAYDALQIFPPAETSPEDPTRYRPQDGVFLDRYVPRMPARMKQGSVPSTPRGTSTP